MKRLTVIEVFALFFTGLAGLAAAVQAYVIYDTRGELADKMVFAQRLNVCAELLTALDPVVSMASDERRAVVLDNEQPDAAYFPAVYFFPGSASPELLEARHMDIVAKWVRAASAFVIVMPEEIRPRIAYFDRIMKEEMIAYGQPMTAADFAEWLRRIDAEAQELIASCRQDA